MTASIISGVNLLVLNVPPPLEQDGVTLRDDLLGLKVWYSTTPNFNELTQGTLAYEGPGLSATIAGLSPGVNYYVKYALISDIDPSVYDVSEELVGQATNRDVPVDLTPPPTPTGVEVSAGITSILISHDTPSYTEGNGHMRTLVYGKIRAPNAPVPTYNDNDVRVVTEFTGSTTSFVTEPATTWHFWLKWLSIDGVLSEVASGGITGHVATTGQDVAKLLEVLTGEITESQLYSTLTSRIDLIDDPETGLVKKTNDLINTYGSTVSAATNALLAEGASAAAIQAKADAIIAQGLAEGSADTASTQAGIATEAKNDASGFATTASQSASAASASAVTAEGAASTASTQAGIATQAKNDASGFATTASQSASAASASAVTAEGAASTASTQAGIATQAKNDASGFATTASQSASAASASAVTAEGAASTASTQAGIATEAKNTATGEATSASVSASNSATSALSAAGSATSAATSLQQVQATIRGTSLGLPLEQWMLNGQTIVPLSDGPVGTKALRLSGASGAYPNQGNYVPLDRTKKYRIKFWARPSPDATGALYFSLRQFLNDTGTAGPVNGGRSPYRPSGKSRTQHIAQYGDTWGEYNFVWSSVDWQDGVKFVQPEFLDNYSVGAGYWDVQGFTFTDVTETEALTATVQTLATTTAGPDGLTAQYTVKTDVAGHVAGFGLSSSGNKTAEVATNVIWGAVATAITRAATGRQPELSKFGENINGRMVGDTNNSGTLSSADGSNIAKFEFGISLATEVYDYINITLRQILYSNIDKYREYLVLDTTGSTTSEFAVTADRFYIAPPAIVSSTEPEVKYPGFTWVDSSVFPNITKYWSGTAWGLKPTNLPFIVQTSPEEINGTMVPAGVYIDTAYIRDATITTAKIADLTVDNAKIANLAVDNGKILNLDAEKITTGYINADRIDAGSITAEKIDTTNLTIKDDSGKVIFSSGGSALSGVGTNLLRSSGFEDGLSGYNRTYYTTTSAPVAGWNLNAQYSLRGLGLAYVTVAGSPAVGQVFDFRDDGATAFVPVTPGVRYEAHVLLNAHRCGGQIVIAWFTSNQVYTSEVGGNVVTLQSDVYDLTNLERSGVFAIAPANARFALIVARGQGLGQADPYLFIKNMYFGQATAAQTDHTPWSPGRGLGQITAANAGTYIANAAIGSAQIGDLIITDSSTIPEISIGTNVSTMTGKGARIYPSGNFAFGNSNTNVIFDGTQVSLNGFVQVSTQSIGSVYSNLTTTKKLLLTFVLQKTTNVILIAQGTFLIDAYGQEFDFFNGRIMYTLERDRVGDDPQIEKYYYRDIYTNNVMKKYPGPTWELEDPVNIVDPLTLVAGTYKLHAVLQYYNYGLNDFGITPPANSWRTFALTKFTCYIPKI